MCRVLISAHFVPIFTLLLPNFCYKVDAAHDILYIFCRLIVEEQNTDDWVRYKELSLKED